MHSIEIAVFDRKNGLNDYKYAEIVKKTRLNTII